MSNEELIRNVAPALVVDNELASKIYARLVFYPDLLPEDMEDEYDGYAVEFKGYPVNDFSSYHNADYGCAMSATAGGWLCLGARVNYTGETCFSEALWGQQILYEEGPNLEVAWKTDKLHAKRRQSCTPGAAGSGEAFWSTYHFMPSTQDSSYFDYRWNSDVTDITFLNLYSATNGRSDNSWTIYASEPNQKFVGDAATTFCVSAFVATLLATVII